MKTAIIIFIFPIVLLASPNELYLLPDESELLLYDLKQDIKKSGKSEIRLSLSSFNIKKIFKILRKRNNRGSSISLIVDSDEVSKKSSLVGNLAVLKNVDIFQIKNLAKDRFNLNFIVMKNRAYIFPYGLDGEKFDKVYGMAIRTTDKRTIKRLKLIFKALRERSEKLFQ